MLLIACLSVQSSYCIDIIKVGHFTETADVLYMMSSLLCKCKIESSALFISYVKEIVRTRPVYQLVRSLSSGFILGKRALSNHRIIWVCVCECLCVYSHHTRNSYSSWTICTFFIRTLLHLEGKNHQAAKPIKRMMKVRNMMLK